jgi:hypothetical protein
MAINPFSGRLVPFDPPRYPAVAPDIGAFATGLGTLGQAIGNRREEAEIAGIMQSATDAQGNLDLNKAATAIALSGRDPIRFINALTAQKGEVRGERAQKALEEHYRATEKLMQEQRDLEKKRYEEGAVTTHPPSLLQPGYTIRTPPGQAPVITPFTVPTAPPGPQSAIENPNEAYAFAGPPPPPVPPPVPPGNIPLQPVSPNNPLGPRPVQLPLPLDPENAPPYQVAGPPTAPPTRPPENVPEARPRVDIWPPPVEVSRPEKTSTFNDKYLATLPSEAARTIVKGVANYEIDPGSFGPKDREDILAAAKLYRPDYNQNEYQKRQSPPSGEIAARVGLGKAFLDRIPNIQARIEAGELDTMQGRTMAYAGQGGPGELRRAIDEGAEALLRGLTGAGMSQSEANNYARRYQVNFVDTKETQLRKLSELENALRYVGTAVGQGRGGEDFLKDYQSKFNKPVGGAARVSSDKEVNDLVSKAKAKLDEAPNSEARARAVGQVHKILQERGVPPQYWPR